MEKHFSPQFRRDNFISLNGTWDFIFDKENLGDSKKYFNGFTKEHDITVPFSYTCKESGINIQEQVDVIWYQRHIELTKEDLKKDIYLHFEGVDEVATIYLNGKLVGTHTGGNSAFKVLLNYAAKKGDNLLVIKVEDDFSLSKARGKQRWQPYNYGCWYTQTNGIYKPVYLEKVNHTHIDYFKMSTDFNKAILHFDYIIANYKENLNLKLKITYKEHFIREITQTIDADSGRITVDLNSHKLDYQVIFWAPHDPNLYDIEITLSHKDKVVDVVNSYFGVAEYTVSQDNVLLNGFSYVSKMVLYQGYYKDSLLTPKDDEAMIKDINIIKSLGFNGIRCHQYIPTERFLYLCDKLGLSVWIEYPSQHLFNLKAQDIIMKEWRDIIKVKYNHPCVFAYVVYNESWGVRGISTNVEQSDFVSSMYGITKAFDRVRPVISNDGWEHTISDVITLHHYSQDAEMLEEFFQGREHLSNKRNTFADGYEDYDKPVFLTEYGGYTLGKVNGENGDWGYGNGANNLEEFYARFESFAHMIKNVGFKGYCYTQYNDVQQEKNGFVDENGDLKVDPNVVRGIIEKIF